MKKKTPRGQGGCLTQILFVVWLKTPCKISEPYDNPFWEKSKWRRKRERIDAGNSGHLVLWQRTQATRTNSSFKCKICEENFENSRSLKKHQNIHKSQKGDFKSSECKKEFDEDWKIMLPLKPTIILNVKNVRKQTFKYHSAHANQSWK